MSGPSITRPFAARTLHLHLTPRIQNVGESRSVLRLLQQFGEVEYFKHFKHDVLSSPRTFLCVFKEDETAKNVLSSSPLNFKIARPRGSSAQDEFGAENERSFDLTARPARIRLRDQINYSHFHGPFVLDTKDAAYEDLVRRVPIVGQSDVHWRAEPKPWKVLNREQEQKATKVNLMGLWQETQKGS